MFIAKLVEAANFVAMLYQIVVDCNTKDEGGGEEVRGKGGGCDTILEETVIIQVIISLVMQR